MPPRSFAIAVVAIGLIAAAVRWHGINRECLWYDEIWHLTLSSGHGSSFREIPLNQLVRAQPDLVHLQSANSPLVIPRRMDQVLHPPLFHLVLRAWRELTDDRLSAVRCLSAGFSVLVVILTAVVAKSLAPDSRAAIAAAATVALSATQLTQAQDARGYTLLAVISLATFWALLELIRRRRSIVLSLTVAAGCLGMMFTHYFAAGACAGIGLIVLLKLRGRGCWETACALLVAGLLWAVLWLPTLRDQLAHVPETADVFLDDSAPGAIFRTMGRLAMLPGNLLADIPEGMTPIRCMLGLLIASVAIVSALLRPASRLPLFLAACVVLPVLLLDLIRSTQHLHYTRYVLVAAPLLWIAIAMLIVPTHGQRVGVIGVIPMVMIVLAAMTLPSGYQQERADFRPLAERVSRLTTECPEAVIVLCSGNARGRDAQSTFLYLSSYTRVFPRDLLIVNRRIDKAQAIDLAGREMIVVAAGQEMFSMLGPNLEIVKSTAVAPLGAVAQARIVASDLQSSGDSESVPNR